MSRLVTSIPKNGATSPAETDEDPMARKSFVLSRYALSLLAGTAALRGLSQSEMLEHLIVSTLEPSKAGGNPV